MKWNPLSLAIGAAVVLLSMSSADLRAQASFSYGAYPVYNSGGVDLGEYKACGFNSIGASLDPNVPSRNLQTLADSNLKVVAALPSNDYVLDCAAYAEMIHWQAEDTIAISLVHKVGVDPTITRVEHLKGGPDGDAWSVDTPDSAGMAWQLVNYIQLKRKTYTALFYLKVDSIPQGNVAQLRVFDQDNPTVSFTRTIAGSDFSDTASFKAFSFDYSNPSLDPGLWRSSVTVEWYGTCKLSMDSVVIFNAPAREYIRNTSSTDHQNLIAQLEAVNSIYLPGTQTPALRYWYGQENLRADFDPNMVPIDKFEVAKYLDSLAGTSPYDQGFTWEGGRSNDTYVGQDSFYLAMSPSNFRLFSYPLGVLTRPPTVDDVALINEGLDALSETLRRYRALTESANVPFFYTAQAFATDSSFNVWDSLTQDSVLIVFADTTRPTSQEIKCFGFMGLCYGVDGLWYWPYDEGTNWYNNPRFSGLVKNNGDTTFKYNAVKDAVGPFVSRFGELIVSLDRQEVGLLDTLAGVSGIFVSSFESTEDTPYVEAGFFVDQASAADYVVLVNRRTDTASTQTLSLTIDASLLKSSGSTMYYLIDKNPTYAGTSEDTTLAGPMNGSVVYTTTIEPGGAKFIKITAGPNRITGTSFPLKWWGEIHAVGSLSLGIGKTLNLSPPLAFKMHLDSATASFTVSGRLLARGTPDSVLTFTRVKQGAGGTWNGITISGLSPACTLSYCRIEYANTALKATDAEMELRHVTTVGSLNRSVDYTSLENDRTLRAVGCDFDDEVYSYGAETRLDSCTFRGTELALRITGSCYACADSVSISHSTFPHNDSIAVLIEGQAGRVVTVDDCQITGTASGIMLTARDTLRATATSFDSLDAAVDADSGVVYLTNVDMDAISQYGVYALDGNAIIRVDTATIGGSPTTTTGISVGVNAKLVSRHVKVETAYIGLDVKAKGADTVIACSLLDNRLYAMYFDSGDSVDYTSDNFIENDTATASNMGVFVNRQSIKSDRDVIRGGYNWNYNYYPAYVNGKSARITELELTGKLGDQWGLVLNGPGTTNHDSAFVQEPVIDSFFYGAHLYLRWLHAVMTDGHLVTSTDALKASTYGVWDRGYTTGHIGCSDIQHQLTTCVLRDASTSSLYWTDLGPSAEAGHNSIYTESSPVSWYFKNLGSDSVDVRDNWWGDTLPSASRFSGKVKYNPWLDSADCGGQGGSSKIASLSASLREPFGLAQNYPNPFNPTTTIRFALPVEQPVRLDLFNVLGQRVRSFDLGVTPAGYRDVLWSGNDESGRPLGSGLYFYRLWTPQFTETKKMLLLK